MIQPETEYRKEREEKNKTKLNTKTKHQSPKNQQTLSVSGNQKKLKASQHASDRSVAWKSYGAESSLCSLQDRDPGYSKVKV